MRIVHWGKYYPPRKGGIESVTQVLAEGHVVAGHSVSVVCFHSTATAPQRVAAVEVLRCRERFSVASQPLGWDYARRGLGAARGADIVHLHAPNLLASLMALRLAPSTKLIVHWHSDVVGKGWLGRLLRPLEQAMLERAAAIICTSPPYAEHSVALQDWRHKVHCIPIGIADPGMRRVRPELPERLRPVLGGRRHVFALGRLVNYKGFDHLIDAARHLPNDIAVVIGGDGPLRHELQSQAIARGVQDRVHFVGALTDSEVDALFRNAIAFCLASTTRSEAFGVVLLEAMARGTPVIATKIPGSGVPWVAMDGMSGLVVLPGDARALAGACAKLASDEALRARLAAGGRQRFEQGFTARAFLSATSALYESVLQSKPKVTDAQRRAEN